ncbi:unnamed protein product [Hanseniaspora opuntiae]
MSAITIPEEVQQFITTSIEKTGPIKEEEGYEYLYLKNQQELDSLENIEEYEVENIREDLMVQILKINEQNKSLELLQSMEVYKEDFTDVYYLLKSFSDIEQQPLYVLVMGHSIENLLITLISDKNGIKNRILYSSNKLPLLQMMKKEGKVKDVVITDVEELKTIEKYKDLVYKNQNYKTIGTVIPGKQYELSEEDEATIKEFFDDSEKVLLISLNEAELSSLDIKAIEKDTLETDYEVGYTIQHVADKENAYTLNIFINDDKAVSPKWRMLYSLNNLKINEFWSNYFVENGKSLST